MCILHDKPWPVYGNPIIYVIFVVAFYCKEPEKTL